MPVLPFSLRAIWNKTGDVKLLQEFVPKLVKYFDWWDTQRAIDGDGLVSIIHGWESGMDASPLYDAPYGITDPQPNFWSLYPKFDELILEYRWRYYWNQTAILHRTHPPPSFLDSYFIVQDVGVNAIYAGGWRVLSELAAKFDSKLSSYCKAKQLKVEKTIIEKCWDTTHQRFISFYHDNNGVRQPIYTETCQSLLPLLLETLPPEIKNVILNTQLLNPKKFWTTYPVPTVSADAPQFQPVFTVDLMWRGPTWPIVNWFITEGLTQQGEFTAARQLVDRWIELYKLSGIYEDYNPLNGDAYGAMGIGMSTLLVDWLYRFGIVS